MIAHHEYAGDIVATVVRCLRGEARVDCGLTGEVVAAAVAAAPDSAALIEDAATAFAPDCADAIQGTAPHDGKEMLGDGKEVLDSGEDIPAEGPGNFTNNVPSNVSPPLGSVGGGGGFNPQESNVQICDNGRQRSIRATRVNRYLTKHPGSFIGNCQITPAVSR